MFRNQSVNQHQFAMVPRSDVPRSKFPMSKRVMTTMDGGYLVPLLVEPVLPGDTFNVNCTVLARLATPIFPFMDNLYFDTFFFFEPLRLVWSNFQKFMGEQENPGDSISYTVPQIVSKASGYDVGGLYDQMGLPTLGQVAAAATYSHSALPLRAYADIYNQWFRDENLAISLPFSKGDGPDLYTAYFLKRRGKRHDYFTSCLPFLQKGGSVSLPLGTTAPVFGNGKALGLWNGITTAGMAGAAGNAMEAHAGNYGGNVGVATAGAGIFGGEAVGVVTKVVAGATPSNSGLYTDLTTATASTINDIRTAVTLQQLYEKEARGGSRYTEITRVHFGVTSPDSRLQRPEYLGGSSTLISTAEVEQTSATGVTGGSTPVGTLAAFAKVVSRSGFSQSFTEHGYIIGLCSVRADLTYQQGIRKHWSYLTKYDFPFPVFANVGEQPVLNKEIYADGSANDALVFGYQERYGEARYNPSEIHGLFRSTAASTIDPWHLSQKFATLPTLGETFIVENPPIDRVVAVGSGANGKQLLVDAFFSGSIARALPAYGVPGLRRF